jgi:hypothetical protein
VAEIRPCRCRSRHTHRKLAAAGHFLLGRLIQGKPDLCNKSGAAPARHQALGIRDRINSAAWPRVGIAGEDKAVLLGEVGAVVAQVKIEYLARECHARLPIQISR